MKKIYIILVSVFFVFQSKTTQAQNLSPYTKVGIHKDNLTKTSGEVQSALESKGFVVIGSYNPEGKPNLKVLAFTRTDLQQTVIKVKDRGALASVLKVGLKSVAEGTAISYINPDYIFNAYLRNEYPTHAIALNKVSADVVAALSPLGKENKPFGGSIAIAKLRKYQYKPTMPYFSDPVTLKTFSSFEDGVKTIEKNLQAKKGGAKLVYQLKFSSNKVAVFGVGLLDTKEGEPAFLPVIGEDHLAALPYEIILQDKVATMLHGRYRIALHWPDLTMGTFMKIMSTPGDIEDALKLLCE